MLSSSETQAVQEAIAVIDRGDTLHGLIALECSPRLREVPAVNSYLAFCIARERGQVGEALKMCQSALNAEPRNPAHYLNLGRVYLLARKKEKAIATFRKGLSSDPTVDVHVAAESTPRDQAWQRALILKELRRLGIRRRPPISGLGREHPLNRILGKVLTTIHVPF